MKRVLDNAVVLCGEELESVHGYVVLRDGVIGEVGEGSYVGPKEDLKRGIICPGLTNAHVHLGDAAGWDIGAYRPIGERVGKEGMKYEIHKKSVALKAMASALAVMKKGGTTAFCDFREGGVQGIEQLRSVLNMPARILGRPLGQEDIFRHCDGLGISSISDYVPDELERLLSRRSGRLVGVHAGEVRDDVEEALQVKPDFLVHLTNAGEESLHKVLRKRVPIVLCPRANASYGVGIPDLKTIFESRNLVALGTDNVMANPPDMLREMDFAWKLTRGLNKDHSFDARTVLRAATIKGRKLLNLPDNSIIEGNRADLIITRGLKFARDPVLAMVHRVGRNDIKEVISTFG